LAEKKVDTPGLDQWQVRPIMAGHGLLRQIDDHAEPRRRDWFARLPEKDPADDGDPFAGVPGEVGLISPL
jgi:hypothetical protein